MDINWCFCRQERGGDVYDWQTRSHIREEISWNKELFTDFFASD